MKKSSTNAPRIIRRRYWSKKKQEWVEKTYTYDYKATGRKTRAKILTSKGKLVQKNYARLLEGKSPADRASIATQIELWKSQGKGILTESRLGFLLSRNKVLNFLDNTGLTVEQACDELGVTEEVLLDSNNWKDNTFTNPSTGEVWRVEFSYDGENVFTPVNKLGE